MYRSIHDGRAPPTGSTFNTTNNSFSCGIHNLGGSTDGVYLKRPYASARLYPLRRVCRGLAPLKHALASLSSCIPVHRWF
jgi:hypothetical protein